MNAERAESGSEQELDGFGRVPTASVGPTDPIAHLSTVSAFVEVMESHPTEDFLVGPPEDGQPKRPTGSPVRRGFPDPIPSIPFSVGEGNMEGPSRHRRIVEEADQRGDLVQRGGHQVNAASAERKAKSR